MIINKIVYTTAIICTLFRPKNLSGQGFSKFVERFGFWTICYFSQLLHILMVLKLQKYF